MPTSFSPLPEIQPERPAMTDVQTLALKDRSLLREAILIDGQWIQADSGRTIEVRNPANGALIARVPDAGEAETRRAIAAAERALVGWRATLAKERAILLRRFFDLMVEH